MKKIKINQSTESTEMGCYFKLLQPNIARPRNLYEMKIIGIKVILKKKIQLKMTK